MNDWKLYKEKTPDGREVHFRGAFSKKGALVIERFCPYCGYEEKEEGEEYYEEWEDEWPNRLRCKNCKLSIDVDHDPSFEEFDNIHKQEMKAE